MVEQRVNLVGRSVMRTGILLLQRWLGNRRRRTAREEVGDRVISAIVHGGGRKGIRCTLNLRGNEDGGEGRGHFFRTVYYPPGHVEDTRRAPGNAGSDQPPSTQRCSLCALKAIQVSTFHSNMFEILSIQPRGRSWNNLGMTQN